MLKNQDSAPKNIRDVLKSVRETSINELWDSVEEIEAYYQDEKNYQKLLNGKAGINVFQFNNAWIATEYMEDWCDFILGTTLELLKEKVELKKLKNGSFKGAINIPVEASYEFKYAVDGEWMNEPEADGYQWNDFAGADNSVLTL